MVFDGTAKDKTFQIYLDGALVGSKTLTEAQFIALDIQADETTSFCIGDKATLSGFKGMVDDVMVFDAALPATYIPKLMDASVEGAILATDTAVRLDASGTFAAFSGATQTLSSITGRGTLAVAEDAEITVATAAGETNSVGTVTGGGTVVKTGAGTLALTRAAVLAGMLDVREGDLAILGGCTGLAGHVVASYTFDDAANPGADASGNGFSLVSTGQSFAQRMERIPGAVYFDGAANQSLTFASSVETAAYAKLPSGDASYTVACWINPDADIAADGGVFSWGEPVPISCTAFRFHRDTGTGFDGFRVFNWGFDKDYPLEDRVVFTSPSAPDGWHHLAITYDSASGTKTRRLYIDGVLQGTGETYAGTLKVVANRFNIGRCHASSTTWSAFKGYIDDFMVLDCPVASAQVRALMQGFKKADRQSAKCRLGADASVGGAVGEVNLASLASVGPLSLVSGSLTLREGMNISVVGESVTLGSVTLAEGVRFVAGEQSGTGTITLPANATVTYYGTGAASRMLLGASSFTGETAKWNVETPNLSGGWSVSVRQSKTGIVLSVTLAGTLMSIR